MKELKLLAGNSNLSFSKAVAEAAGVPLCKSKIERFSDGEVRVEIHESIRGADVFVIQSTCPPVNENYMELFIILDALKRASANSITAVIPYFGYARQDRKVMPRVPISAKCVSDLLHSAGADRVVSVDLHSAQIQGFFNCPFDHLHAIPTMAEEWIKTHGAGDDFVVVSPDAGGVERARVFAKRMKCSIAIIDKRRLGPNEAKAYNLIGEVQGKTAILVDDIIDTAGTMTQAMSVLKENGAKKVCAITTHALLSGPAVERLAASEMDELWVTDTIPLSKAAKELKNVRVVSVAPMMAEAIRRIYGNDSVSSLFDK